MQEERRRFFRIQDEAEVSYRLLSEEEYSSRQHSGAALSSETLAQIETEIGVTLSHLKSQNPRVATLFELLNQKINLLMSPDALDSRPDEDNEGKVRSISLSACGMAFPSSSALNHDQKLLIQLKLKPSNVCIVTSGCVVECCKEGDKNLIRVDFRDIDSSNQDLLLQHLFQAQSRALRQEKEDH